MKKMILLLFVIIVMFSCGDPLSDADSEEIAYWTEMLSPVTVDLNALCYDYDEDTVWAAGNAGTVLGITGSTAEVVTLPFSVSADLNDIETVRFWEDEYTDVYAGGDSGVLLARISGIWQQVDLGAFDADILDISVVRENSPEVHAGLWLATDEGLFRYDLDGISSAAYYPSLQSTVSTVSGSEDNYLAAFYADSWDYSLLLTTQSTPNISYAPSIGHLYDIYKVTNDHYLAVGSFTDVIVLMVNTTAEELVTSSLALYNDAGYHNGISVSSVSSSEDGRVLMTCGDSGQIHRIAFEAGDDFLEAPIMEDTEMESPVSVDLHDIQLLSPLEGYIVGANGKILMIKTEIVYYF